MVCCRTSGFTLLAGVAMALGAAGCVATQAAGPAERPPVICEWAYSNFAWGAVVRYRSIGADGRELSFDSRSTEVPMPVYELLAPEHPSAADLARRYAVAEIGETIATPDEIARLAAAAAAASDGTIMQEQVAFDAGQTTLQCFVPAESGGFERVVIVAHGDFEERNSDPAATEVATLVTSILGIVDAPLP